MAETKKILNLRGDYLRRGILAFNLDKACSWEAAGQRASDMMSTPRQAETSSVNVVKKQQQKVMRARSRKCYNCGKEGHFTKDKDCPAKEKKCEEIVESMVVWLYVVVERVIG